MKLARIYSLFLGLGILLACLSGLAQTIEIKKTEQGLEYITGGIGVDEVEVMNTYIDSFSLRLLFSEGDHGRSITGVNVNIYDNHQNLVFQLNDAQPQLFVNLPKGTYYIQADYNGDKQGHLFHLKENDHKKVVLNWKNLIEEDSPENDDGNGTIEEEQLPPSD